MTAAVETALAVLLVLAIVVAITLVSFAIGVVIGSGI